MKGSMKDGEALIVLLSVVIVIEVLPTITTIKNGSIELKMRQIELLPGCEAKGKTQWVPFVRITILIMENGLWVMDIDQYW